MVRKPDYHCKFALVRIGQFGERQPLRNANGDIRVFTNVKEAFNYAERYGMKVEALTFCHGCGTWVNLNEQQYQIDGTKVHCVCPCCSTRFTQSS